MSGGQSPAEKLAARLANIAGEATEAKKGGRGRADGGATAPHDAGKAWQTSVSSEYAEVHTGAVEAPIESVADWDGVLRHFGLDPAEFEIMDDTVKMSSWQQSKRTEDGDRDVVWLYAYKARFRRVAARLPETDLEQIKKDIARWRPIRRTPGAGLGAPSTLCLSLADWQLGKGEGGGAAGTTQRVLDAFDAGEKRLKELRRIGRNVTSVALWNMGDPNEGCYDNYANQAFTTDLNRREQLNLAIRLHLTGIRTFAPLADDVEWGSVLCNHGEWSRAGGPGSRSVTDDSDNIGGFLGDTIRTVMADRAGFDHVRYLVPHDEMTMVSHMSGVTVALAHGHKAPGTPKELTWLHGETVRILRERRREVRLWMLAHRHHYSIVDHGPWHRLQMPSLDYGSKNFTDGTGKWSTAGTFTCLVGEHEQAGGPMDRIGSRGFSDEYVIAPTR